MTGRNVKTISLPSSESGRGTAFDATAPQRRPEDPAAVPEGKFGRYVVHDKLGEGGMGVVYRAFDPRLDRNVALKLLHPDGGDGGSGGTDGRLLREAQAMARLSHPNVITVHDVGTMQDRVFVAMELALGGTLRQWQSAAERDWSTILATYRGAGEGLAAAHTAGLIHRDFKPDNVLIGEDDRPRVVDFGLARFVDQREVELKTDEELRSCDLHVSRTGASAGTPAYMAPEQHLGEDPTPAADQFAFCVALYEGLYGRRPFPADTLPNLVMSVLEDAPLPPPSDTAVPRWVWRRLRRGLHREPTMRYPTMRALLDALARDPRVRRRRLAVSTAALVTVGAGAWFTARATQPVDDPVCTGAAAKIAAAWNDERGEALRAAFVRSEAAFAAATAETTVATLDDYARTWTTMHTEACEATRVRGEQSEATLDRRMACLDDRRDRLVAAVEVLERADLAVIAEAANVADGLPSLDGCADTMALAQRAPMPADPDALLRIDTVGRQHAHVLALSDAGLESEASQALPELVASARDADYGPLLAEVLQLQGHLLVKEGAAEAEAVLEEAVWLALSSGADGTAAQAATELTHHVGYLLAREVDGARWYALATALLQRSGGGHSTTVRLSISRGASLMAAGKFDEAEAIFVRARAIAKEQLPATHRMQALANTAVANALFMRDETDEALALYQEAAGSFESALGPWHPALADVYSNIGNVYFRQKNAEESRRWQRKALAIVEKANGERHPDVASALMNLGASYSAEERWSDAVPPLERALAIYLETVGPERLDTALAHHNLGMIYEGVGRLDDALLHAKRACEIHEAVLGPDHLDLGSSLRSLASVHRARGEVNEAREVLTRTLAIYRRNRGEDDARTKRVAERLAELSG